MNALTDAVSIKEILTNYPFPIAFEYALLQDMIKLAKPADDRCEQLRRVMWFASRYLATVAISSYWHTDKPDLRYGEAEHDFEQHRDTIKRKRREVRAKMDVALEGETPGGLVDQDQPRELRKWFDVVFEIADFWKYTGVTPFTPEILDWASPQNQELVADLSYSYDLYTNLESRPLDVYFKTTHEQTLNYLRSIYFLTNYPLVKVLETRPTFSKDVEGGRQSGCTWIMRYLMGQVIQATRQTLDSTYECPSDRFESLSLLNTTESLYPILLPLEPLTVIPPLELVEPEDEEEKANSIAVLDERFEDEKKLRYRLVALGPHLATKKYVTWAGYVDMLNELMKKSEEPKLAILDIDAGWSDVRNYVMPQTNDNRKRIGGQKYRPEHYLERVSINNDLDNFLGFPKQVLLIVGAAGVGKTNLLCHISDELAREDRIIVLHDCRDFESTDIQWSSVENQLARELGLHNTEGDKPMTFVAAVEHLSKTRPESQSAQLVFLLDALNEHPEADKFLEIIAGNLASSGLPGWVKIVITCRSESWERSLKYGFPEHFLNNFYLLSGEPISMKQFDEIEAKKAYTEIYRLQPAFETLSQPVRRLLMDPLMLGLAHRVYEKTGLPPDVHQNRILREYLDTLIPPVTEGSISEEQRFLVELLMLMYTTERTEVTLAEAAENKVLKQAYSSQILLPNNPYIHLVSTLLRDAGTGKAVTFRYERVFEYALGDYILKPEAEARHWSTDWFEEKVEHSSSFPSLWGATRGLLIDYLGNLNDLEAHQIIDALARSELYDLNKLLIEGILILANRMGYEDQIRSSLNRLVLPKVMDHDPLLDTRIGEVGVTVAQRLGWVDILENGARSPLVTVRTASVQAIYYIWRQDKEKGLGLMKRVAKQVRGEIVRALPKLAKGAIKARVSSKATSDGVNPFNLLPLTSSLLSLTMMMISHCLREPETAKALYEIWDFLFGAIPGFMEKPIERFVRMAGAQSLMGAWAASEEKLAEGIIQYKYPKEEINIHTLQSFGTLPLGHETRKKVVHYLKESEPGKGRLTPIMDEVVEIAKVPDAFVHFVPQVLFLTRGHPYEDDVLYLCEKMCASDEPYDRYEGTTKMGVYLYSIDQHPEQHDPEWHLPERHVRFMEEQVLWIWRDSIKQFQLAGDYYLLNQLRYPMMYECSPVGGNRMRGQIEFVTKVREQPWRDNPLDRDIAIIQSLGEAAVFGNITYNTYVIPFLETLQIWFDPKFYQKPEPAGEYFRDQEGYLPVSKAVASALARIRAIYPDEVERYLSYVPGRLRELTDIAREESASSFIFLGGQAGLAWCFTLPTFRDNFIHALMRTAEEATDVKQGFQIIADEIFKFSTLRAMLSE